MERATPERNRDPAWLGGAQGEHKHQAKTYRGQPSRKLAGSRARGRCVDRVRLPRLDATGYGER